MLIDLHTHIFPDRICRTAVERLSAAGHIPPHTDGSAVGLIASMAAAGVDYSVNLPVMTRPDQVEKVNSSLIAGLGDSLARGIVCFGGLHPDYENCAAEARRLRDAGIRGVKLHPAYQQTDADSPAFMRAVAAASEAGLICVIHSGLDIGFPGRNYADPGMIARLVREVAPDRLVLAHMGGWQGWQEAADVLAGLPVYVDTAFALGPLVPLEGDSIPGGFASNLDPEGFAGLVRAYGADRVLFGSDSPWADQAAYAGFVRSSPLTEAEKELILGGNAERLLGGLPERSAAGV